MGRFLKKQSSMRVLIQNAMTEAYYTGQGWSKDISAAKTFDTTVRADTYCHQNNLRDALIVVKFKDESGDIKFISGAGSLMSSSNASKRI
jgi:hypothetical protein